MYSSIEKRFHELTDKKKSADDNRVKNFNE